ncbi:MAG: hypothetical protein J6P16_04765, partial [Eubacterium sp.]|nr:hypothetical protein [Eubacterium sp.]
KNLPTRNQLFLIGKQLFLTDGQTIKKINIKTGKLKKVKIKMPYIESVDESSIAVSSNKLYIYGYRYDKNYNKTYVLYRFTYTKKKNTFKIQNLSKAVKTAFGSEPGDAVITTVSGGIAIIGPVVKTNGYRQDTHILKDNKKKISTIARTSCYHKVFNPVAVYSKGLLYVLGVNDTESDGAFFRSTKL